MPTSSKAPRKLTDSVIKNTPVDPTKAVKLNAGNGLLLVLMPTGAKLWRTRYRLKKGTDKTFSHGAWGERGDGLSLRDARLAHENVLALARAGTDPVEHRKQQEADKEQAARTAKSAGATTDAKSFAAVGNRWYDYANSIERWSEFMRTTLSLMLAAGDGVGSLNDDERTGVASLFSDLANQAVEARRATTTRAHS